MCERLNWLGAELKEDSFGSALLAAGIPAETILAWTKDPQVQYKGEKASLFDSLEDVNSDECLARCCEIAGVPVPAQKPTSNSAFMFIKPHAVTAAVKSFVASYLAARGIKIVGEGELDNKTIESKKLIDNHYYAIANKASLTKPVDLNPPAAKQEEFKEKWGLSWDAANEQGLVYNAVDGCTKLGLNGDTMNTLWAKTKKAKEMSEAVGDQYMKRLIFTKKKMGAQTLEANNNAGVAAANQIVNFFEKGDVPTR